ncbi:MAG: cytochrome b/b6 domain-containing protein [Natronospirillum sp.]|uniref:cytochrome b/b6 domain-containing protein n=1 Tax=Natronospirillum sp. TaxID=2812955 RepID=UPI0025EBC110|nr:cytochrome b/b6 domain-containing protein [Natronospirillum sp.]MCH8552440.1 cytochrome b/b6 domain-containing protein [Natronospirillum sp.]
MTTTDKSKVAVWDLPTRLFHWLLVIGLVGSFVTISQGWMQAHFYFGYLLTGLILFRVLWGLVGTTYARFTGFNLSVAGFFRQLRDMATGSAAPVAGHNPAGAVMVLILLLVIGLQAVSGLFYTDDVFWFGPFFFDGPNWAVNMAAWLHPRLPMLIMLLVSAHLLALIYHRFRLGERLVGAMIHGRKSDLPAANSRSPVQPVALMFSLLAVAGWLVYLWLQPI